MGHSDIWAPLPSGQNSGRQLPAPTSSNTRPSAPDSTFNIRSETAESLAAELTSFCDSSGASYASLISENGVSIAHSGHARDLLARSSEVPALAIGAFFATRALAERLGETEFEGLYQQGANRHLFLTSVGRSHLLLTVFSAPTNVGIIRLCATESAPNLSKILETGQSPPVSPQPEPQRTPPPLPLQSNSSTPNTPVGEVAETLNRPAPTSHLKHDSPPAKEHLPTPPPSSQPPISAPTIAAFERRDPPTRPFPSD